jgi:nucleoside-diphosphate-sugar epimerase
MSGKTIVVTGIAGYLGQVILPHLQADETIQRVIGIDRQPPPDAEAWPKLEFHQIDVRADAIEGVLRGADILLHMAFRLWRLPGRDDVDAINIHGSEHVLRTAARQGIPKIIFTSSVVAYGLHSDNPTPLTEQSPLRPNPDLYYSRAKAAVERTIESLREAHPDTTFTILRPCTIVGPNADPGQMQLVTSKTTILVRGHEPPGQLVHEQDVAQAIMLALHEDLPGAYNVAGDEPRTRAELLIGREGARVVQMPHWMVRLMFAALWRTGLSSFAPEWVDLLRYPFVVQTEKLKRAGWRPQYTTPEAYRDLLRAVGESTDEAQDHAATLKDTDD